MKFPFPKPISGNLEISKQTCEDFLFHDFFLLTPLCDLVTVDVMTSIKSCNEENKKNNAI